MSRRVPPMFVSPKISHENSERRRTYDRKFNNPDKGNNIPCPRGCFQSIISEILKGAVVKKVIST